VLVVVAVFLASGQSHKCHDLGYLGEGCWRAMASALLYSWMLHGQHRRVAGTCNDKKLGFRYKCHCGIGFQGEDAQAELSWKKHAIADEGLPGMRSPDNCP
jgi:hypothetical protein